MESTSRIFRRSTRFSGVILLAAAGFMSTAARSMAQQCVWTPAVAGTFKIWTNPSGCLVGIGTTAPTYLLQLEGAAPANRLAIKDTNASGHLFLFNNGGTTVGGAALGPGYLSLDDATSAYSLMIFNGNSAGTNAGYVAVGTNNPWQYLTSASGYARIFEISSAGWTALNLVGVAAADGTVGDVAFTNKSVGASDSRVGNLRYSRSGDNRSGQFEVWNRYWDGIALNWVQSMVVNPNGNIGIGTPLPFGKLDVSYASAGFTSGFAITNSDTSVNAGSGLLFRLGYVAPPGSQIPTLAAGIASTWNGNTTNADLFFRTQRSGALAEAVRIKSDGKVGIGTNAPADQLHLAIFGGGGLRLTDTITNGGSFRLAQALRNLYFQGYDSAGNMSSTAMVLDGVTGNVGIGSLPTANKLEVVGNANFSGTVTGTFIKAQYQDVAEWVPSREKFAAGTVLILDPARRNGVIASRRSYDTSVAGVVSSQPGVLLGQEGADKVMVATTGRVRVRVDAKLPIRVGDLLVTSDREGYAMRSVPVDVVGIAMHRPGTLIGKALEPLDDGEGEILVLLSLQ